MRHWRKLQNVDVSAMNVIGSDVAVRCHKKLQNEERIGMPVTGSAIFQKLIFQLEDLQKEANDNKQQNEVVQIKSRCFPEIQSEETSTADARG